MRSTAEKVSKIRAKALKTFITAASAISTAEYANASGQSIEMFLLSELSLALTIKLE